jgi:hypothetical protein
MVAESDHSGIDQEDIRSVKAFLPKFGAGKETKEG